MIPNSLRSLNAESLSQNPYGKIFAVVGILAFIIVLNYISKKVAKQISHAPKN
jgi:flagellar biogenesis protein FliO